MSISIFENLRYSVKHNEWVTYNRSEAWDVIRVYFTSNIPIPILLQWIKFVVDFQNLYKDNPSAMKMVSVDLSQLDDVRIKEITKFLCKYTIKNKIEIYCKELKDLKWVSESVFEAP